MNYGINRDSQIYVICQAGSKTHKTANTSSLLSTVESIWIQIKG